MQGVNSYQEQKQLEAETSPEVTHNIAKIGTVYDDGVSLIFAGEEIESEKHYAVNASVPFSAGDTVYIAKVSGTYIVVCNLTKKDSAIMSDNTGLYPIINGTGSIGKETNIWEYAYIKNINVSGNISVYDGNIKKYILGSSDIYPDTTNTGGIGTAENIWENGYISNIYSENILPKASGTGSIGASDANWKSAFITSVYSDNIVSITKSNGNIGSSDNLWKIAYITTIYGNTIYPTETNASIGSTSKPWGNIYIGNGIYYWNISNDAILPSIKNSNYFDIGSSTYPVSNIYATNIYVDGNKIASGSNFSGSTVMMGGSNSYYIVCNTSRELRPYSSSTSYPCYLGTSSYYWHYAYIGSNSAYIGNSSSSKLGFFGTTPVARKTVSSTADVATLITALKAYGLIG